MLLKYNACAQAGACLNYETARALRSTLRARAPFSALNILVLKMDIWNKMSKNTIKVYIVVTIFSPKMALNHSSPPADTISTLP